GGERPAARGDDPALVRLLREKRAHGEGERNRQADVAEVEERRVREHVRVLQARHHPGPVRGSNLGVERTRDEDEHEGEEGAHRSEDGHDPRDELARRSAGEPYGHGRVAGQDQQPEEERALLAAPERRQRVAPGEVAVRVLRDVREGEVASRESGEQDERGDGRCPEGGEERVPRREREAAPALASADRAGDERVENETEREEEGGAAQRSQGSSASSGG